jgi:hypothetical protein
LSAIPPDVVSGLPNHQGGDGIDHYHVDRARPHESLADLERLLAGVGL